jgi:hypothetical protein
VVKHPCEWAHGGYCEIQKPPRGTEIINVPELSRLCGFAQIAQLQQAQRQWVAEGLRQTPARDDRWSEELAVVSSGFVAKIKKELGARAMRRQARQTDGTFTLRERLRAIATGGKVACPLYSPSGFKTNTQPGDGRRPLCGTNSGSRNLVEIETLRLLDGWHPKIRWPETC